MNEIERKVRRTEAKNLKKRLRGKTIHQSKVFKCKIDDVDSLNEYMDNHPEMRIEGDMIYEPSSVISKRRQERKAICKRLGISMKRYRKMNKAVGNG